MLESAPIERVNFMRDEMANMVWYVESTVPSQTGQGVSEYEPRRRRACRRYVGRRERAHSLLGHDGSSQLDSVHSRQAFTFWISPERIISVAMRAVASAVL